ncbi:MAG: hypothetical protein NTW65_08570 [Deltaproteobacteria bacterium]|nr:hypothetical protein [Deltaproteobacteria bacterium]
MKRFWLILLSLGLIMAFSVSAFAVDVKVSGEYYAAGLNLDKRFVADVPAPGTAFFYQRLRIGTDFVVSPCLKLVTRFDALERVWGADRSTKWNDVYGAVIPPTSATYSANNAIGSFDSQNISLEVAYIDYTSPIGLFQIGYMPDYVWGTIWGNRETGPTAGQIKFMAPVGPVVLVAAYAKEEDHSATSYIPLTDYISGSPSATRADRDYDSYRVGAIYNFKGDKAAGEVGALFIYNRDASNRGIALGGYMTNAYVLQPYFKAKIGPVKMQGEVNYMFGNAVDIEIPSLYPFDVRLDSLSAFLDADANFGMFSVGGSLAYVQGDSDAFDAVKHDGLTGGRDWDPCLIMFNNTTIGSWVGGAIPTLGPIPGYSANGVGGEMKNAWFGQLRAGITPVPQFTATVSGSYAQADQKPTTYVSDKYGWELDLTGTYKITNNLSYMLGFGYFFTGDYYKATSEANKIVDDYILINKLTLSF